MTGFFAPSMALITVRSVGSANALAEVNSRMSAPPEKPLPAPISTSARIPVSDSTLSSASTIPCRTSWPRPFTGGLSSVSTATVPWRVKRVALMSPPRN